jgi:regulator of RNase E activity RraB
MAVRHVGQSAAMAADEETEFEVLAEGETPEEHDLEILEALEEHGADLSEPYEVRVNLSFPSEAEAEAAGSELEDAGYDVVAFEAAGEEEPWTIRATRELSVGRDNVAGFRSRFADLAERHGGEFDGWEAAAEP